MEIRFPDMYKHQSLETQLIQDLVFIHVHNVIEEDIYELTLWQYINELFQKYSVDELSGISFFAKTSFKQFLIQRGLYVLTKQGLSPAKPLHKCIK